MRWSCLFALVAIRGAQGAVLRGRGASLAASLEATGDWAALLQAESEDRNFLLAQLHQTESELVELQQLAEASGKKTDVLAGLQISAKPVVKSADKNATVAAKPAVANATVTAATAISKTGAAEAADPSKIMASLGIPGLKSKLAGTAALVPMLAMLKGMYQDSKDRIAQQNVREEKSKKWFTEKESEHKAKLARIEGKFKNGTLSEEFRTNETRDETRYFSYWSRCRERQHRQFHTNLKIQHGMMMKVKKMIDIYEKTLSGKASDHEAAKKKLSQMTGVPEIVLLQEMQHAVTGFCRESLAEVRKEKVELQQWAQESNRN